MKTPQLSVVVPVYNEAAGIEKFHTSLLNVLNRLDESFEVVYVDDGSYDETLSKLQAYRTDTVRLVRLTRNFGKEAALTAGLRVAQGEAVLMMDGDGQHPVERIHDFVRVWRSGMAVVVGRRHNRSAGAVRRLGSRLFYGIFSRMSGATVEDGDFRLIDRTVCDKFNSLTERNRMTRSLIDWFGYPRAVVMYEERSRQAGKSPYTFGKLVKLAIDSAISQSSSPLYVAAYAGIIIIAISTIIGIGMAINYLLGDPLGLRATASAYGLDLILFLIGLLLVSQGIIGLYLSHIYAESQGRPLYVIDEKESRL